MSTTHTLWKKAALTVHVTEQSDHFSVGVDPGFDDEYVEVGPMTKAELVDFGVKAIVAASYSMDTIDFRAAVRSAIKGPTTYAASYLREMAYVATHGVSPPRVPASFREALQEAHDFADAGKIGGTMEDQRAFAERLAVLLFVLPPEDAAPTYAPNPSPLPEGAQPGEAGLSLLDTIRDRRMLVKDIPESEKPYHGPLRPFTAGDLSFPPPSQAEQLAGRIPRASPTGRFVEGGLNIQSIPIKTPEGKAIRDAFVEHFEPGEARKDTDETS